MTIGGRRRAAGILAALLMGAGLNGAAFGGTVSRVTAASTAAGLEIRIFAAGFFDSRLFLLDSPKRIVLDISGVGENTAAPLTEVNAAGVRSVRASRFTSDVVRIVIDLEGDVPTYKFSPTDAGFLIVFPKPMAAEPPISEIVKPEPAKTAGAPAKTGADALPPQKTETKAAAPEKKIEPPPVTVPPPSERAQIAIPVPEAAAEREKIFRVTAAADLFLFRDAVLAEAYGKAVNYGCRLDVRLLEFGGFWLGADYYGRSASDTVTGGTRTIRLIPIEAGIKFIMSRGALAPYIGFGASYFLFREDTSSTSVRLEAFGLTSIAGFLFRLGRSFFVDGFVRYRRLPVDLAVGSFDAGGFHFGGGLSWAF
jgi:hypothetical protein